mmetsp:Transcript_55996/g.166563  ORF Transcript_55996/g.166563 Transcript_55996/m.166563 type:complete len:244 (-) Transcript_55996:21-752(-)
MTAELQGLAWNEGQREVRKAQHLKALFHAVACAANHGGDTHFTLVVAGQIPLQGIDLLPRPCTGSPEASALLLAALLPSEGPSPAAAAKAGPAAEASAAWAHCPLCCLLLRPGYRLLPGLLILVFLPPPLVLLGLSASLLGNLPPPRSLGCGFLPCCIFGCLSFLLSRLGQLLCLLKLLGLRSLFGLLHLPESFSLRIPRRGILLRLDRLDLVAVLILCGSRCWRRGGLGFGKPGRKGHRFLR